MLSRYAAVRWHIRLTRCSIHLVQYELITLLCSWIVYEFFSVGLVLFQDVVGKLGDSVEHLYRTQLITHHGLLSSVRVPRADNDGDVCDDDVMCRRTQSFKLASSVLKPIHEISLSMDFDPSLQLSHSLFHHNRLIKEGN